MDRIKHADDDHGLIKFAVLAVGLLLAVLVVAAASIVALDWLDGRPMSEPIAAILSFFGAGQ